MKVHTIFEIIVKNIAIVLPALENQEISNSNSLEELGANSMDRADIVMMVLEDLDLKIPLTQTFGPSNIGELAELLYEKIDAEKVF